MCLFGAYLPKVGHRYMRKVVICMYMRKNCQIYIGKKYICTYIFCIKMRNTEHERVSCVKEYSDSES